MAWACGMVVSPPLLCHNTPVMWVPPTLWMSKLRLGPQGRNDLPSFTKCQSQNSHQGPVTLYHRSESFRGLGACLAQLANTEGWPLS